MSHTLSVPAPNIQDFPVQKPLQCGPGPCDLWPSVIEAMSKPVISSLCDAYYQAMKDIREGCKYLFQTKSDFVLAMSGSGHSGMEAVITNLVAPRQTILIATRGMWEVRAEIIASKHGCKIAKVTIPMEQTFTLEMLEPHLRRLRPTALFITHGDSSTGTVQNLEGLGSLCHKYGTLLLVDTVVSIGGEPFFMDAWEVDAVYASSQKALSGPAGISPIAFSKRAEKVIKNRKFEPPFYLDCKALAEQWSCFSENRVYHHTLSPPLIWALCASLQELIKETLEKSWARHKATTLYFHKRLQESGFDLMVPNEKDRLTTVTTVTLPKQYDYKEFVNYIKEKHNILIFPGLGPTAGKTLRIGLMGVNSTAEVVDAVVTAMIDARRALTKSSL